MERVVEVKPREGFAIWLRYTDGTEGVVDLSDVAGKGVFSAWKDRKVFESVRVGESGAPEWPGGLDICPDALYMEITGKSLADLTAKPKGARSA